MSTLSRASLRYALRHPWQFGLSVLGVALGVAVVVAIDLSNESAHRAFALSREAVFGRTTHQVTGGPSGIPEETYARLRREGVTRRAAPVVEGHVATPRAPGFTLTLIGVDPFAERPFRPYLQGLTAQEGEGAAGLIAKPNTLLLSDALAAQLALAPGERFVLETSGRRFEVTLLGVVHPADAATRRALDDLVVADIATAQTLLGMTGRLTRIDLMVPEGEAGRRVLARIREYLPPGATMINTGARSRTAQEMTRAFELNLIMLSLLALVVGMFLIYNTMTFSVIQRRSLIGTLRAIGVSRHQILGLVLLEAGLVGLAGTLLGLGLGVVLAEWLLALVTRTINDLYFTLNVRELTLAPIVLWKGAALGLGAAVVAAAVPAVEATRVPPRAAIARSLIEARAHRLVAPAAAGGVALLAVGAALLAWPDGRLGAGFAALFTIIVGFTLLAPGVTLLLVRLLQPLARACAGALGPLSVRGVAATLSRTAIAIAALMVALAASVGVGVMVDSFRESVASWLRTTLTADVYVSLPDPAGSATLDEDLVGRLGRVPGVAHVAKRRAVTVESGEGPAQVIALEMAPGSYAGFHFIEGAPERVWQLFDEEAAVLVSEPYAWRWRARVGDTVTLHTDRGRRAFSVAGVFRSYGSDQGVVVMSRATFKRFWDAPGVTSLGIYAGSGVDAERLVEALRSAAAGGQSVRIRSNRAIRKASLEVFDRTFTVTLVLRLLATLVAFVGVLSALMALQLERARELAVLRAQGLTQGQVWGVVSTQTGIMGFIAGLLSMPLGLVMALVLILVINRRSFGWSLDVAVDPVILLQALGLAVGAALIAGVYPALKMAGTPPALALRGE
ncbi:MAG: ABC transporter permease [Gammaproteobacteria bacterium]|nr:ABC transporter permease [Gammaproteobacteria bacterium]NIR83604.1 ABC transporter permease [Gammaproteobacteria bacterium]NIR91577.1 ABC transporter permease [Gammaproteobacteria bacterium]NIU04766.1 ABC transporter permease [Gammaproteobacteria bacterium]NIV53116.1 FtsX-like permease family protein [Gammaproteobacteria bacterium]